MAITDESDTDVAVDPVTPSNGAASAPSEAGAPAIGITRGEDLRRLSNDELLELFEASPAPASVRDVEGDPAGVGLAPTIVTGGRFDRWLRNYTLSERFVWHGKGFRADSDESGWGYNRFGVGPVLNGFPFRTYFGSSRIDGRRSLILDFDVPRNPWWERLTWDELREVAPGVMLGATGMRIRGYWQMAWFAVDANRPTPPRGDR